MLISREKAEQIRDALDAAMADLSAGSDLHQAAFDEVLKDLEDLQPDIFHSIAIPGELFEAVVCTLSVLNNADQRNAAAQLLEAVSESYNPPSEGWPAPPGDAT